jgi:eukaryotic-like serine/threonine-protein kinase
MVPSRIGKYEVIATIGRGSMGEVYKARDTVIDREVALKTMSPALGAIDELRQRFQREAQSAGSLNHANIVTVFDFGEDNGQAYMAMELLEGRDLKELIRLREPLPLAARLAVMEQICDGLAFAHSRHIVHRDLKPANIHVLPGGHVKVMDFGLARLSSSNMTRAGVLLGTPHYMSPEQVRGEKADARSDVFSLGIVCYELLAYRKPFDGDSMHAVMLQILNSEPAPLREVAPGVPARLERIVDLALAKDRARRFRDAGELREALRAIRGAVAAGNAPVVIAPASAAPAPAPPAPATLVDPVTVRIPAALGARAAGGGLGPFRNAGAARVWRRRREPALAGAALLALAALLVLAIPVRKLGGAAVRLAASPVAFATAEPGRLLGAIASSLPVASAGQPALSVVPGESAAGRVQAALDAGDAVAASKELDSLLALAPGHPSLPAMAARLEGLLTARVERATEDLTRAHEARMREEQARGARAREAEGRAKKAALRPRRPEAPPPAARVLPAPSEKPQAALAHPLARKDADQEPLVRRAVKELEQALEERDVRKLRSLTTDLSPADEKAIEASAWRGIRVAVLGVDVRDGQATAQVLWSLRTQEGTVSTVRRTLSLERSVSGWKIATIGR